MSIIVAVVAVRNSRYVKFQHFPTLCSILPHTAAIHIVHTQYCKQPSFIVLVLNADEFISHSISLPPYCTYLHARIQIQIYCTHYFLRYRLTKECFRIITQPVTYPPPISSVLNCRASAVLRNSAAQCNAKKHHLLCH